MVSFVRSGIPRQISDRYAAGAQTVVAYLLDHAIEDSVSRMAAGDGAPESAGDRIVDAIRAELDLLPGSARLPVLLTRAHVRRHLRELIEDDLPAMAVLAYEELPPHVNVQPIARIALGA